MKNRLPILLTCLALISLSSYCFFQFSSSKTNFGGSESVSATKSKEVAFKEVKGPAVKGPAEFPPAMWLDQQRKKNPITGELPSHLKWEAVAELIEKGRYNPQSTAADRTSLRASRDASYSWEPIDDFFSTLAVTRLVHDPLDPQTYYFCTGEGWFNADGVRGAGVWKSIDAGQTWNQLDSTKNALFYYCQDMGIHPITGDVYVGTRSGGVQRSADGGLNWEQVLGAGNGSARNSITDIEFTSDGGMYVGIGVFEVDGLYFSETGDIGTWNKLSNGFPSSGINRVEIATAPSDPNIAYAIPVNSGDRMIVGVFKTEDRGATWVQMNNPGGDRNLARVQGWYDLTMAVDPNNPDVVVAGGLDVWRSRDGALSWDKVAAGRPDSLVLRYMHVDQHEIRFQSSDIVYFGNDGGIWKCENFTEDVPIIIDRNLGYNVTQFYAADIHPTNDEASVIGGTQDNGSNLSLEAGLSNFKKLSGADGSFCQYNYIDGNFLYTSKQFDPIYRFSNGGFELPDTLDNPNISSSNLQFINAFEMDANDPNILYQASSQGVQRLSRADTAMQSWVKACKNIGTITAITAASDPAHTVYVGRQSSNAAVFRIENAHQTDDSYEAVDIDPNNNLPDQASFNTITMSSISADPNDPDHIVLTYANYGVPSVWESKNAQGASPTWTRVEGNLPDIPVNWCKIHPGNSEVCYLATEIGLFFTDKLEGDSTNWILSSGFPSVRTDMIRYRTKDLTAVVGTHGRGIYTSKLDPSGLNNDLVWQERGPINIGGRTRTIMIDPNDPSGETV
ncbi:MAG: photosystem II stability/assembly factor-like uncharacterized protein, partial [Limisphaerales bacterium]